MNDKKKWVSRSVSNIAISAIKEMAMRSAKVAGAASLTWGLPSFRTPEHIRRAVEAQLEADPDIGKYALPDGLPELRAAEAHFHTGVAGDHARSVQRGMAASQSRSRSARLVPSVDSSSRVLTRPRTRRATSRNTPRRSLGRTGSRR